MRRAPIRFRALFHALRALLLSIPATAHSDPGAELIVHRAYTPLGVARASVDRQFAERCELLGLVTLRRLDDGLPALAVANAGRSDPFAFDPARIVLVAARDSAAAARALAALLADPGVAWVERNETREPAVLPPDYPHEPLFDDTRQWGLMNPGALGVMGGTAGADIHARAAWVLSVGSDGVRLALADTGVDPDQPELQAPLAQGGFRMELGVNVTAEPSPSWADTFGHGTPVAGVMAARTHEGVHFDSLGMAGVCGGDGAANPGCRIVPIKIAPGRSGTATSFDIARAILYATGVGARAVNLSFAGGGPSRLERLAMLHAITHGCVVVAAAGNHGWKDGATPQYPAAYAAEGLGIQVGASDPWDRRAAWSSYGPGLDLVAPGVDIWSCLMTYPIPDRPPHPYYLAVSGTSFAAPFVTGTIGLLAAFRPDLMDTDFQRLLRESAHDVGELGIDAETGWGRLDAAAALAAADPSLGLWHDEVAGDTFLGAGFDTLVAAEPGPGTMERVRGPVRVERIEVRSTVILPDSFAGPDAHDVRVWPRVGGTYTTRGAFRMPYWTPWAEVIARDERSFTLRGYVFRIADSTCAACAGESWLPLPLDQARFGFTVLGPVRRAAATPGTAGAARGPSLQVAPNPFRNRTLISGPPGACVVIMDTGGRSVRRTFLPSAGDGTMASLSWDGRDARGRMVRPGLYFVRCERTDSKAAAPSFTKVVRLE